MEQTRTYTHLSPEERAAIMLELHHAREDNRPLQHQGACPCAEPQPQHDQPGTPPVGRRPL